LSESTKLRSFLSTIGVTEQLYSFRVSPRVYGVQSSIL
jgi:hypothetical protein